MTSIVENIDCMIGMARYPDKYFDLAVVDPPYGINVAKMAYLKEASTTTRQKNGSRLNPNKNKMIHEFKEWDNQQPPAEYFNELLRVSKDQIIWGINYYDLENIGTGRIEWDKCVPDGVSFKRYEYAYCSFIAHTLKFQYLWSGFAQGESLSNPITQQGNKKLNEKRIHPTQKPKMLYRFCMSYLQDKNGKKVLDTHLGGGSSRIAAHELGLYFTGFEIDKDYYEAQEKRWSNYKAQLKLFV